MLGFFKKIGEIGRKIFGGVKNVIGKAAGIAKKVLPVITPIVSSLGGPKGAAIMTGINTATSIADRLTNGTSSTPPDSVNSLTRSGFGGFPFMKHRRQQLDSPRIQLRGQN